jgi:hypothetical protein
MNQGENSFIAHAINRQMVHILAVLNTISFLSWVIICY